MNEQLLLMRGPGAIACGIRVGHLAVRTWTWVDQPPTGHGHDLGLVTYENKGGSARACDLMALLGYQTDGPWSWIWDRSQALVWRIPGEPLLVTGTIRTGHPPLRQGSGCRNHAIIDGLFISIVELPR
jgi:hypothetical protein